MTIVDSALEYARRGWPVLPLHFVHGPLNSCSCADGMDCGTERAQNATTRPGKHPIADLVPNGARDATTDEATISEWWRRVPLANIGVVVGPKSNLFVIDVDVHDEQDGFVELKKLEQEHRRLTETLRFRTGGGGMHYVYRYPTDAQNGFKTSVAPGVELRAAENTYIVVPPSVHHSGQRYIVDNEADIAEAPLWLIELGKRECKTRELPTVAQPGQRHASITSMVGTMMRRGFTKEAATEAALAYNHHQCNPPKPDSAVTATVDDLYYRYDTSPSMVQPIIPRQYVLRADGLYWVHAIKTGNVWQTIPTKLANFDVLIEKEITLEDGAEKRIFFEISGEIVGGRRLERLRVSVEEFARMQWPYQWGVDAVIQPGYPVKEHLRTAIQERSSGTTNREFIYQHTGWARVHDEWKYLHAGGAIDRNGLDTAIRIDLSHGRLRYYDLPAPPTGDELTSGVRRVLGFVKWNAASPELIYPALGEVFRAPLAEACPVDFSDFLAGGTGTFKSAFQAVMQAFYGKEFTALTLPANWSSTANSLERQTFLAKDAITVIDDFAPRGGANDVSALHRKADQVFRGQGNLQGRGRMRQDRSLAPEYYPRGLICSSGEDVPKGPSLRGRLRISETKQGMINADWLTEMQHAAAEGECARVMAAYLRWLAPRMDELKQTLPAAQDKLRDAFSKRLSDMPTHARTASILASVYMSFDMFMLFACDVGALSAEEGARFRERCRAVLIKSVAPKQVEYLQTEDEVNRFIELLASALSSGHAYVADAHEDDVPPTCVDQNDWRHWGWKAQQTRSSYGELETTWRPQGRCIGWIGYRQHSRLPPSSEQIELYLDSQSAMAVVQTVAREQGSNIPITWPTLLKRLGERGLILRSDADRKNAKVRIGNSRRRVVVLDPTIIVEPPEPQQVTFGELDDVAQKKRGVKNAASRPVFK